MAKFALASFARFLISGSGSSAILISISISNSRSVLVKSILAMMLVSTVFADVAAAASSVSASTLTSSPTTGEGAFVKPTTLLGPAPPYVPWSREFSLELGLLESGEELFNGGASYGVHLGRCVFSDSETCQQYLDALAGFAVREAETHGLFLGSLRWQYVNFPARYSPFWRVFAGESIVAKESRSWHPTGGVGFGVVNYLHEKVDLRLEIRVGKHDRWFMQGLLGFQIKVDHLLEYFAVKLKDLGVGAVGTVIEATGTAVKATGEGLGGIVEGVSAPFRGNEQKHDEQAPADQERKKPE
jgi:hypothetical protein